MGKRLCSLLLCTAMIFAVSSCELPTPESEDPGYNASQKYEGKITIRGSRLTNPLLEVLAREYSATVQPNVEITLTQEGCLPAVEAYIGQTADIISINFSTDQDTDKRIAAVYGDGQTYQYRIAQDGVAVIVNKENTWATELTKSELCSLLLSGGYKPDDKVLWSDIREDWPQEEIALYGPDSSEGLSVYIKKYMLPDGDMSKSMRQLDDYSAIVTQVAGNKNAIAVVGISTALSHKDEVTVTKIDFGRGPIEPSIENVNGSGSIKGPYSEVAFTCYLLINAKNAKNNPQVADFIKFILSDIGAQKLAAEHFFIPLQERDYTSQLQAIQKAFK